MNLCNDVCKYDAPEVCLCNHLHASRSQRAVALPALMRATASQVSDHMDFGKEDTDEEKAAALGSILSIGEACKVKVVEVAFDERCAAHENTLLVNC
jgi:hypothetical protein